jgi:hypothetical protein
MSYFGYTAQTVPPVYCIVNIKPGVITIAILSLPFSCFDFLLSAASVGAPDNTNAKA